MRATAPKIDPPEDHWFIPSNSPSLEYRKRAEYLHERMRVICRNSLKCKARLDYEPGWNDRVHSPMLEESLAEVCDVDYRNM